MTFIDDVDLDTYCGRVGNLYVRHGLCPPFTLRHADTPDVPASPIPAATSIANKIASRCLLQ